MAIVMVIRLIVEYGQKFMHECRICLQTRPRNLVDPRSYQTALRVKRVKILARSSKQSTVSKVSTKVSSKTTRSDQGQQGKVSLRSARSV